MCKSTKYLFDKIIKVEESWIFGLNAKMSNNGLYERALGESPREMAAPLGISCEICSYTAEWLALRGIYVSD